MKKFDTLYNKVITEAEGDNIQQPEQNLQPQVPSAQEVNNAKKEEPTADVTSEGKKFLVELMVQALGVGPDNIPASEKGIFNTQITTKNADEILKKIQSIVDLYS